jgi:hypothetical protein
MGCGRGQVAFYVIHHHGFSTRSHNVNSRTEVRYLDLTAAGQSPRMVPLFSRFPESADYANTALAESPREAIQALLPEPLRGVADDMSDLVRLLLAIGVPAEAGPSGVGEEKSEMDTKSLAEQAEQSNGDNVDSLDMRRENCAAPLRAFDPQRRLLQAFLQAGGAQPGAVDWTHLRPAIEHRCVLELFRLYQAHPFVPPAEEGEAAAAPDPEPRVKFTYRKVMFSTPGEYSSSLEDTSRFVFAGKSLRYRRVNHWSYHGAAFYEETLHVRVEAADGKSSSFQQVCSLPAEPFGDERGSTGVFAVDRPLLERLANEWDGAADAAVDDRCERYLTAVLSAAHGFDECGDELCLHAQGVVASVLGDGQIPGMARETREDLRALLTRGAGAGDADA